MNQGDQNKPKDKEVYLFNALTGELDLALAFNPDRIVTASLNSAGGARTTWDATSNSFISDGPAVVIDNNGNVVKR